MLCEKTIEIVKANGSYVAPDWLHREAVFILEEYMQADFGKSFEELDEEQTAQLTARLTKIMRTNTYDENTKTITIDPLALIVHCTFSWRSHSGTWSARDCSAS